ncbi:hypothetical protein H839_08104 [Parageobacillus genomosp. 1]|uniref:Uncharacterized protein n=1 Tax=Parageobacillus genomosp. 1 TaxID=1295642 RepID=A0ABC9VG67_9BACL|nr:hypothetical protein [Parageobacillus genomosp. 1]EZP77580.1 hypothetical protein H839_08104 [Parageobacillus genomosp. 1]
MNNKKLLKEIKEHLDFIQFEYDRQGYISTNTADELIEYSKYLIEKVEQLQQEIEQLNNLVKIKESHEQQANNMVHLLEQQLQQAQAKAERYEKALKEIAEWSGIASREYRIAKKALEG